MERLFRVPAKAAVLLFCLAAVYFMARGPWRAIHAVNSYDFASVYGATRCWLKGENPYDMPAVAREVQAAGDDPATLPNADPPPSVYLPTAFPLVASVAWLPWKGARLAWTLLSIAVFGYSVLVLFRSSAILSGTAQWLIGAAVLLFSPTSSGLSTGNPSVISCGLTLAALCLALQRRTLSAALLLGLAHCIKPQISIAAFAVFTLWKCWRMLAASLLVPAVAALVSFLQAGQFNRYALWVATLRHEIGAASLPGGLNDPSPANYFSYHLINSAAILSVWLNGEGWVNALVWMAAAALACSYLLLRSKAAENARARDIAFCCSLSLVLVYHRYYDAQLLLGVIPFLLLGTTRGTANKTGRLPKSKVAIWIVLLVLLFPLQAILAESLPRLNPASLAGLFLLRHQPFAVLILSILIIPWASGIRNLRDGQEGVAGAKVSDS